MKGNKEFMRKLMSYKVETIRNNKEIQELVIKNKINRYINLLKKKNCNTIIGNENGQQSQIPNRVYP